jgi:protein-S-isoprenylcysteine O-methyltransferase Ste14
MIVALLILLVPFALRELVHWRVSRGTGGQKLAGGPSVALWGLIYVALLGWAGFAQRELVPALPDLGGWLVLWAGALLRAWALLALRSDYSVFVTVRPGQRVVASGPYRYLRHPLHLGLLVEMAGLTMLTHAWGALILLALALATLVVRNVQEERLLALHLGAPYQRYRASAWDVIDLLPWTR